MYLGLLEIQDKNKKINEINRVKSVDAGRSICYSYQTRKDLGLFFMLKNPIEDWRNLRCVQELH